MENNAIKSVAVTGGLGNLGWKLLSHLAATGKFERLVGLDIVAAGPEKAQALEALAPNGSLTAEFVECDLTSWHDERWQDALKTVDAVVHFAALNPYPDATWGQAAISYDMTLHIALAAVDSPSAKRMVFATSNHVMGRYKDMPLADTIGAGELTEKLAPGVGTLVQIGDELSDSTAYATSKLMGERLCRGLASQSLTKIEKGLGLEEATTFACIRIGWCQPGENRPETLSATGDPDIAQPELPDGPEKDAIERAENWFKGMWLSNRDFAQIFEKATTANGLKWPGGFLLVNGMSNNQGMKWSLEEARARLGYTPEDDVWADSN
ncbi:MAG: NAD(P)-dependent oxidoreductase [Chloroflexota bacterium]